MSLSDYKITDAAIAQNGVVAAPDKLTGTAAQNKAVFDRLIRESVKGLFNSVVETLEGAGGAGSVGVAPITGVTGGDVQSALGSLKLLLDAKSAAADTDLHIKSVSFDASSGVFTFTREDGSYIAIDTALEKVATNWQYDAATQSLVLTLSDGSTQSVPLSAFITETEFADSGQIAFSVSNHQVTATVKAGSITDTMLASALVTQLQDYASSAISSAAEALASRDTAVQKAASIVGSEAVCTAAANSAQSYAVGGTGTRTGEDTDNAKYYCEQAEQAMIAANGVRSFNARSGVVTAQSGDYSPSQVGASPELGKGVNLLDNWYFIGGGSQLGDGSLPINQRGKATYSNTSGYTLDRWKLTNSGTVALQSDSVKVTQSGANAITFKQILEQKQSGVMTLSLLVKSVSGTWTVSTTAASGALSGGPLTAGLNVFTGTPQALTAVSLTAANEDDAIELLAVKLEWGDHQTLVREVNGAPVFNDPPPNLGLELLKCQRYFQIFRNQSQRPTNRIDFRPTMAADPAQSSTTIGGTLYYTSSAEL